MTTTYYSSDWHLGHARICELCDRPFADTDEMNHAILTNTNRVVPRDGRLILLGDTAMGKYEETMELLRQIVCEDVVLLPGNHDRFSLAYRDRVKQDVRADELRALGFTVYDDRSPSEWLHTIGDTQVVLSHYPYTGDSGDRDRYSELRPQDEGLPLVHGHVHTRWRENGRMLNVGVDQWDFAPVSEDTIAHWIASLPRT